jgi:hypothetical protein
MRALYQSLVLATLTSTTLAQADSVFRPIPFEQAVELASSESRLVFASFVLADSEDCRRQAETWTDDAVARYLEVETVAVEVDGAARADLAERLGIEQYPTLLVLAADGTEVDRIRGFCRPRHFVLAFTGLLEAKEMILAARALVAAGPEEPLAHMELGRALATGRGKASAVEEYQWVWAHCRPDPALQHLRLVKVLTEMDSLASKFEPARKRMLKWRRAALKILEEGELDDQVLAARELGALNDRLSEPEAMLKLYVKVRDAGDAPPALLDALFDNQVARQLYNQKRYDELLTGLRDPLVRVEELLSELDEFRARERDGRLPPEDAGSITVLENGLFVKSGLYFEVLLAVEREKEAIELKDYLLAREPVSQSYIVMMRSARKARAGALARQIGEDGLAVLVKKQRAELQRAYKQLFGKE